MDLYSPGAQKHDLNVSNVALHLLVVQTDGLLKLVLCSQLVSAASTWPKNQLLRVLRCIPIFKQSCC